MTIFSDSTKAVMSREASAIVSEAAKWEGEEGRGRTAGLSSTAWRGGAARAHHHPFVPRRRGGRECAGIERDVAFAPTDGPLRRLESKKARACAQMITGGAFGRLHVARSAGKNLHSERSGSIHRAAGR